MRNPSNRNRAAIVRRIRSCHGSDCPERPHTVKGHRCIILTRVDYADGRQSDCWVSGDHAETCSLAFRREQWQATDREYAEGFTSERVQRKRFTADPRKPVYYGGGFWERVTIGPVDPHREVTALEAIDRDPRIAVERAAAGASPRRVRPSTYGRECPAARGALCALCR